MANLYEQSLMDVSLAYYNNWHNNIYMHKNVDLQDTLAKDLYQNYINTIIDVNPKEYFKSSFIKLSKKEIKNIVGEIIIYIFGNNEEIKNELNNFFNSIVENQSKSIFNSTCLVLKEDNHKIFKIDAPALNNISSIVTLCHEFTHYHLHIHDNAYVDKKHYYEEILSILVELITIHMLKEKEISDIRNKIINTRLEIIAWHYSTHLEEIDKLIQTYIKVYKISQINPLALKDRQKLEQNCSWLKNEFNYKRYTEYDKSLRESYGLGFLYAYNLLVKILEDKNNLIKIRELLNGHSISDLLEYYQISTSNFTTYEKVNTMVRQIRQK